MRGFTVAVHYLADVEPHGTLRISLTTQMKLIIGCRNRTELRRLERFLTRFAMLGMTEAIGNRAMAWLRQYWLSHGLCIADALIAATALTHGETLFTKNVRHFRMIPVEPAEAIQGRSLELSRCRLPLSAYPSSEPCETVD